MFSKNPGICAERRNLFCCKVKQPTCRITLHQNDLALARPCALYKAFAPKFIFFLGGPLFFFFSFFHFFFLKSTGRICISAKLVLLLSERNDQRKIAAAFCNGTAKVFWSCVESCKKQSGMALQIMIQKGCPGARHATNTCTSGGAGQQRKKLDISGEINSLLVSLGV